LLIEPKMSNHARGLWGYGGKTANGEELTVQSTGMGGPSAAVVLADLAKLGVRRAVRIGTCAAVEGRAEPGESIVVASARAEAGSAASFGAAPGEAVPPDAELTGRLQRKMAENARLARIASFDTMQTDSEPPRPGIVATDMQTATVFASGRELGIALAAVLIVAATARGERIADAEIEAAAKRCGRAAAAILSP
jgi:uridine phosphorylase